MNEDKKEFLFLGEEDRKLLGGSHRVFEFCSSECYAGGGGEHGPSVVKSVLDKLHWLWPAGDAQGRSRRPVRARHGQRRE